VISVNLALDRAFCRISMSDRAKGPGVQQGGGGRTFSSCITMFSGKLMKGTLDASVQTAKTNLPPCTRLWYMRPKTVFKFAININPHLQTTASNDDSGNSSISPSPSMNSIMSCNPNAAAICFAIVSICKEISAAKT
jgi:hypothetical protein